MTYNTGTLKCYKCYKDKNDSNRIEISARNTVTYSDYISNKHDKN